MSEYYVAAVDLVYEVGRRSKIATQIMNTLVELCKRYEFKITRAFFHKPHGKWLFVILMESEKKYEHDKPGAAEAREDASKMLLVINNHVSVTPHTAEAVVKYHETRIDS